MSLWGTPHDPRTGENFDATAVEARVNESRETYRSRYGDTLLAMLGVLMLGAMVVGLGWRRLSFLLR